MSHATVELTTATITKTFLKLFDSATNLSEFWTVNVHTLFSKTWGYSNSDVLSSAKAVSEWYFIYKMSYEMIQR